MPTTKTHTIFLSDDDYEQSCQFDRDCYPTTNYTNKKLGDNITCKMGELATYYLYHKLLVSPPDFTIQTAPYKSFNSDLKGKNGITIHCKAREQHKANKYGASWLFNVQDPVILEPTPNDYARFIIIDKLQATLYPLIKMRDVKPLLKLPRLECLHATKKCLYYSDLPNMA